MTESKSPRKRRRAPELTQRLVERVKELRREKGWSQLDLSHRLGLQKTSVANYEQGVSFPPLPTLDKMARLFGVTLDSLVWGTAPPEQIIHDRELLELFRRLDTLSARTRAAVIEVLDGVVFKAEQDEKLRRKPSPNSSL